MENRKSLRQTCGHTIFHAPTTTILERVVPDFPSVCSLMMNYYGMREADGTLFIKQHLAVGPAYNVTVILAWLNENVFKNRKEIGGITGDHAYHGGGAI